MSVVLYIFGAALLVWSAFLMLTGGMVATLDIAAGLAGSGVFAFGLGAVVSSLEKLTRAVATTAQLRALPGVIQTAAPREEAAADAPRSPEHHAPKPPAPSRPVVRTAPAARRDPPLDAEPAAREPEFPAPVVVAPILGGGFAPAPRPEREMIPDAVVAPRTLPEAMVDFDAPATPEVTAPAELDLAPDSPPAVAVEDAVKPAAAPERPRKEPRVPEWLARARARREAKIAESDGGAAPDAAEPSATIAAVTPVVAPDPEFEPEQAFAAVPVRDHDAVGLAPAPEASGFDQAAPLEPAEEAVAYDPSEVVVREGEHNGVMYRFFEDGSIEAKTEHGVRRFASIDDLRSTILAARGRLDDDTAVTKEDAEPVSDTLVETLDATPLAADAQEPAATLDAEATNPNARSEPEPRAAEDPFEAALAALQGGPRDVERAPRG